MLSVEEVEKFMLDLPDNQRARLAVHLLRSLPPVLQDDDDGIEEAFRRDADFDADPAFGRSLDEFDQHLKRLRS